MTKKIAGASRIYAEGGVASDALAAIEAEKRDMRRVLYSAIRGTRKAKPIPVDVPPVWSDNPVMEGRWRRVSIDDSPALLVELATPEGTPLSLHYHGEHDELVVMLSGKARFTVEGVRHILTSGYSLTIPAGTLHEAFFITDCHFLKLWTEALPTAEPTAETTGEPTGEAVVGTDADTPAPEDSLPEPREEA